ncbi:MAG: DUF3499 family protein, partial [Actinobacteria bacterium]|nr:DUF3499 family protein [Actinomycetota bacterium]
LPESHSSRDRSRSLTMMTHCSKPGCPHIASVVLAYDYAQQKVVLDDATGGDISPHHYAMCLRCAEKLKPPRGWTIDDRRVAVPLFASERTDRRVSVPEAPSNQEGRDSEPDEARQLFFGSSL